MGRGKRSRIAERNEGEAERMRNNDEWFTELNVMVLLQVVLLLPTVLLILAASHTHTQHSCTHPWRNPLQDLRPTQIHSNASWADGLWSPAVAHELHYPSLCLC
jgi:hypothetical protein